MPGEIYVTVVVAVLALSVVALVVIALRRGRTPPLRTGPWVVALVLTVIPALFITIVAVVTMIHGSAWVALGAVGLWALVTLTIVKARWAAWAYLVSGVAFPILLAIGALVMPAGEPMMLEPANGLMYTIRVAVAAALLIWATHPVRQPTMSAPVVAGSS